MMRELPVSAASYHASGYADDDNRFFIGKGYMGIRSALEEYRKHAFAPVLSLAWKRVALNLCYLGMAEHRQ